MFVKNSLPDILIGTTRSQWVDTRIYPDSRAVVNLCPNQSCGLSSVLANDVEMNKYVARYQIKLVQF